MPFDPTLTIEEMQAAFGSHFTILESVAAGGQGAVFKAIASDGGSYDASHYLWYQSSNNGLWYKVTLQTVLAHELDHLNGADGHIDENGVNNVFVTTNTRQCSDVDMGSGIVTHP